MTLVGCDFGAYTRIASTQVELKNLNSFRAVQESVDFEIVRQSRYALPIQ